MLVVDLFRGVFFVADANYLAAEVTNGFSIVPGVADLANKLIDLLINP
jgi:hypothetical protein